MIPYREFESPSLVPPMPELQCLSWWNRLTRFHLFVKKGGGLHHVCYEIDDLESGLRVALETGLVIAAPPAPAVAFGGRRIAWVCSKNRLLMELLERHGV
jgi:methylmalonyl-CoA/ethylmalonyl-CoA epimerase